MIYSNRTKLDLSNGAIRFQISISVESYDEKNFSKLPKFYVAEKHIISKLSKNKGCVKISRFYILNFLRNKSSKSVTFGSSRVRLVHRLKRFSWSENGHKSLFQFFLISFKGIRAI